MNPIKLILTACAGFACFFIWRSDVAKERAARPAIEAAHAADEAASRRAEAWRWACEGVRAQLKAPAAATFSAIDASASGARERVPAGFLAWGEVEAVNEFGARIRHAWQADVFPRDPGQAWKVENVRISKL